MIKISIDQNALNKLVKSLGSGMNGLKDFHKPFNEFGKLIAQEQQKNFEQQGAIYQGGDFIRLGGAFANLGPATTRSQSWRPLATSTRKDRVRHGYNAARPILVRSGKLKNAFKNTVRRLSFITENTSKIAEYHQEGNKRMPQRRVMGFSKKGVQALKLALENYIISIFKLASSAKGFVKLK